MILLSYGPEPYASANSAISAFAIPHRVAFPECFIIIAQMDAFVKHFFEILQKNFFVPDFTVQCVEFSP